MYEITMTRRNLNVNGVYKKVLELRDAEDELSFIDGKLLLVRDRLETFDDNLLEEFEKLVNRADELLEEISRINEWLETNGIELRKIG